MHNEAKLLPFEHLVLLFDVDDFGWRKPLLTVDQRRAIRSISLIVWLKDPGSSCRFSPFKEDMAFSWVLLNLTGLKRVEVEIMWHYFKWQDKKEELNGKLDYAKEYASSEIGEMYGNNIEYKVEAWG